ncbi:MAG: serine hydrolase [Opitutaceae bacterium]
MIAGAWRVAVTVFVALLHPGGLIAAREDAGALQRQLEEIIRSTGVEAAIAIKDPASGLEVLLNADRVMPVAGGIRIHLIAELFRQAAEGKHSLDEVRLLPESARVGGLGVLRYMSPRSVSMSLRDYATLVVTAADNSAANFLTDLVGMEAVNRSLRHQGTPEIRFQRRAMPRSVGERSPDNVATARSTIRALELLHAGKVVNRAVSEEVIAVLSLPEVSYVRRRLPQGWRFAGLSGHGPGVRSDQGLLLFEGRSVSVCFLLRSSSGKPPRFDQPSATDELMSRIWTVAVEHFARRVGGVGVAGAAP